MKMLLDCYLRTLSPLLLVLLTLSLTCSLTLFVNSLLRPGAWNWNRRRCVFLGLTLLWGHCISELHCFLVLPAISLRKVFWRIVGLLHFLLELLHLWSLARRKLRKNYHSIPKRFCCWISRRVVVTPNVSQHLLLLAAFLILLWPCL